MPMIPKDMANNKNRVIDVLEDMEEVLEASQSTNDTDEMAKLDRAVEGAQKILFKAKTVFPFDFFPDEIIIDENKVDIIYGRFILTREVVTLPYKTINSASSYTSIFFGSLEIEVRGYERNPEPLKSLWNNDAIKARRLINGLVTCDRLNITLTKLKIKDILSKVEKIGRATDFQ